MSASKRIALVTCSTRSRRLNPYMTNHVQKVLAPLFPDTAVETIDLAGQNLSLFDEPVPPAHLPAEDPTPSYAGAQTRAWSATVRQYHGFVFVTPQYNWSIPASLKNALDHLFFEWKGKPVGIVSYGGRGGGKAAGHLRDILNGLRMKPASTAPGLTVTDDMMDACHELGRVRDEDEARWRQDGVEEQLVTMAEEMKLLLSAAEF